MASSCRYCPPRSSQSTNNGKSGLQLDRNEQGGMKHGSEIQSGYCTFLLPETQGGFPAPTSDDTQLPALQFQDFWHPLPASEGPEHMRSPYRQGSFILGDTCVCKGGYVCVQTLCDGTRVQETTVAHITQYFSNGGKREFWRVVFHQSVQVKTSPIFIQTKCHPCLCLGVLIP